MPDMNIMMIGMWLSNIFAGLTLIGAVLLIVSALKIKTEDLWGWAKWFLIVGILGTLITSFFGYNHIIGGKKHDAMSGSGILIDGMMGEVMDHVVDEVVDGVIHEAIDEVIGH